jgi:hypothetical protein
VGSAKRLTALSVMMGAAILVPFALYAYAFQATTGQEGEGGSASININSSGGSSEGSSSFGLWVAVGLAAALFVVGDSWAEHVVRSRLPSPALATKLGLAGYITPPPARQSHARTHAREVG